MIKMPEVRKIASQYDIKSARKKKTDLIQEIQGAEGNVQCYATNRIEDCPEVACLWREDCTKEFAKS